MDDEQKKALTNAIPEVAKSFFSQFPVRDNHKLNLYADLLGFLAALIISYFADKIVGPTVKEQANAAWELVKTLLITWGFWFMFLVWCVRTTFYKNSAE